jgi:hypothetical protein
MWRIILKTFCFLGWTKQGLAHRYRAGSDPLPHSACLAWCRRRRMGRKWIGLELAGTGRNWEGRVLHSMGKTRRTCWPSMMMDVDRTATTLRSCGIRPCMHMQHPGPALRNPAHFKLIDACTPALVIYFFIYLVRWFVVREKYCWMTNRFDR